MSMRSRLFKKADSLFGPLCCRLMVRKQRTVSYPDAESVPGPALVIRPGGIGDAVLTLPMLSALRAAQPHREIHVLCESRNREIFAMAPMPLTLLSYDTAALQCLRTLRGAGYGLVVDTEQYHHFSGVLAAWTRAPLRAGFKINARRNGLYTHLVSYDLDGPEERQFGRLIAAICGRSLPLPSKFGLLAQADLPRPPACVPADGAAPALVHAGGSVPEKRWHPRKYAAVCDALREEFGLAPILVGGADDRGYAAEIAGFCEEPPADMCGELSLAETASLCKTARLLVGPDSGIAHLATAVGTECVVLFGPSDPRKWGPGPHGRVLQNPVPCGPCAIFGYNKPCLTHACITEIQASEVIGTLRELLSAAARE